MKDAAKFLTILTLLMLAPWPVEHIAQHDALGPVIGITILAAIAAVVIFSIPVKNRR